MQAKSHYTTIPWSAVGAILTAAVIGAWPVIAVLMLSAKIGGAQ